MSWYRIYFCPRCENARDGTTESLSFNVVLLCVYPSVFIVNFLRCISFSASKRECKHSQDFFTSHSHFCFSFRRSSFLLTLLIETWNSPNNVEDIYFVLKLFNSADLMHIGQFNTTYRTHFFAIHYLNRHIRRSNLRQNKHMFNAIWLVYSKIVITEESYQLSVITTNNIVSANLTERKNRRHPNDSYWNISLPM